LYNINMSRVIVVKWPAEKVSKGLDKKSYKIMLEAGLTSLFDSNSLKTTIDRLFPGGIIGMKTNCLTRKFNSTPVALTDALSDILINNNIKENNIVVWERTNYELEQAGYKLNASSFGRRCLGTDSNGVGYSRDFYGAGDVNSLVTGILTNMVDHNINVPVLKDHSIAGLSGCLKNMYGAIHNPNKYHGNNCNPYAAHVSQLEPIKSRNRLSVIDATRVQYNFGPGYDSRYIENFGGLIISIDSVAADRVGLEIVETMRRNNKLPSLKEAGRPPDYLQTAGEIGLGIADMQKIELKVFTVNDTGKPQAGRLF